MDAFFASVEQNDNPGLKGKPIVVGSPSARGVIAAASYEARKFGVRSAMPSTTAKKICPDIVFVKHRMSRYKEVSDLVFDIFYSYTSRVEPLSIDEAFLDISDLVSSYVEAEHLSIELKERIKVKTGLSASVGISFNKFLAKLASDMEKPNAIVRIDKDRMEKLLPALPIEKLFGIGKVTAEKMHLYGIHNCEDLRKADRDFLIRNFGKAGEFYYSISRGVDLREVEAGRERKSVGAELTFEKDLTTNFQIIAELYKIEKILWERILRHGKSGRTVTLKVKYDDFTQHTKSHTLERIIDDFDLLHIEVTRLRELADFYRKKVRLMGVTISNLQDESNAENQLNLWTK